MNFFKKIFHKHLYRKIGEKEVHYGQEVARIRFYECDSLGVGCMGAGGDTSVFAVNVEYAYTHIAGICVAISSNCMVARRASSRILPDGTVEQMTSPDWFGGR